MHYGNIKLIPRQLSHIKSRNDVDLSVLFGGTILKMPILHSPMDTIGGVNMSQLFFKNGLMGCFPKLDGKELYYGKLHSGDIASVGLNDFDNIHSLYKCSGIRYFLIDTANGFNTNVEVTISNIKSYTDSFIIAGNVASAEGYKYLTDLGVDAVRVGIGTGEICLTTPNTGIGQGMVSSVIECYEASLEMENPPLIIADGGIKSVGDISKALAIGADLVMSGSMFAGCKECPGNVIMYNNEKCKVYRGSASYAVQSQYKDKPYYIEGEEMLVKYKGSGQRVINQIDAGLRSALSYMGATTIVEFKENCQKNDCIKFM